jgi:hypothetical protein
VTARRFVLVGADHPIVSAISENADKLQTGEITMMPYVYRLPLTAYRLTSLPLTAYRLPLTAYRLPLDSCHSEGLVKVSQTLYDNILPLVKTQVESQIKVRDMSKTKVVIEPAEFGSWSDARAALVTESIRPLKAKMESDISKCKGDDDAIEKIRAKFGEDQRDIEHKLDHSPMEVNIALGIEYNFLSK